MTGDFEAAGISLVAISTESVEGLQSSFDKLAPQFPILSDAELKVFRHYRAFDDFENKPLHGTFLIDGSGLVRWQDISYEPFNEVKFLLAESKRLLGLPPATGTSASVTAR
jgi:peroxiredoxin